MENNIFREKSIARISSPEQLDDYIKVTRTSVWVLLAAMIVLLLGGIVFVMNYHYTETCQSIGIVENGEIRTYISDDEYYAIKRDSSINAGGETIAIERVEVSGAQAVNVMPEYVLYKSAFDKSDWVHEISGYTTLADGIYAVEVVLYSGGFGNLIFGSKDGGAYNAE